MSTSLVILAAGKGTRMNSDLPKVLHPIAQASMLEHAMAAGRALAPERTVVVAYHEADLVRAAVVEIDEDAIVVLQEEQLGTATRSSRPAARSRGLRAMWWCFMAIHLSCRRRRWSGWSQPVPAPIW